MTEHGRDPLQDAIESLRAFARELPPEAARTRQRVLVAPRKSKHSRLKLSLAAGLTLAFGATAFAHFTGRLPPLMQMIAGWIGPSRVSHHATARGRGQELEHTSAREPPIEPHELAAHELEPHELEPHVPSARQPARAEANPSSTTHTAREPARKSAKPVAPTKEHTEPPATDQRSAEPQSEARALYLIAHRAHFGGGSPEAALRAWDAFLAAAPADPFAPEARYNRAILLLKLDRFAEALEALKPFACSAPGSYRQREASVLIARARAKQPQLPAPSCEQKSP